MTTSPIFLYNTPNRGKEVFKPLSNEYVRIYDCGPTVYMYAHIGNMWRYIVSDLVRRVLEYNGYVVKQVMNITDVGHLSESDLAVGLGEDRIDSAARREKKTPLEIANFYIEAFLRDMSLLNIQKPHQMPKATEHVGDMIAMIQKLESCGAAYPVGKYIFFDTSKFPRYGQLSGKDLEKLRVGARLEPVPGKRHPFDFALWICDPEHLQVWDSPWGRGYPGWHIECSAMSMRYLGEQLDIHSGGEDNIFPHHENEIAQTETITGKQFVRYWLHVKHNLSSGRKMSKSLGNFYTLSDLSGQGFRPLAYRYLCLTVHYRSSFNFTLEGLRGAQEALLNLKREMSNWVGADGELLEEYESRFVGAINDDLNLPKALSVVWDLVRSRHPGASKLATLLKWDRVLALGLGEADARPALPEVPPQVTVLLNRREELRRCGDYVEADKVRQEILSAGYSVEDTASGPRVTAVR